MKPRNSILKLSVDASVFSLWLEAADKEGKTLTEWVEYRLNLAAGHNAAGNNQKNKAKTKSIR